MVKTSPFNAGGPGLAPGQGPKDSTCLVAKTSNILTYSEKTFKNGPHQTKKFLLKKPKEEEEETQSFLSPQRGHVSTQDGGYLEAKRGGLRMKPTLPVP